MARINLHEDVGNNLITRNVIEKVFSKVNHTKDDSIIMDFKGVEFVSRSSADEYLRQKELSAKKISEENLSVNVKKMLEFVQNSREEQVSHRQINTQKKSVDVISI
jgi:hypothetical protein